MHSGSQRVACINALKPTTTLEACPCWIHKPNLTGSRGALERIGYTRRGCIIKGHRGLIAKLCRGNNKLPIIIGAGKPDLGVNLVRQIRLHKRRGILVVGHPHNDIDTVACKAVFTLHRHTSRLVFTAVDDHLGVPITVGIHVKVRL